MNVYGIDHVQVAMPEGREAEARSFYVDLMGLTALPKPPTLSGRGGAWFQCGSIQLHIGVDVEFRPAKKAHPALLVRDLHLLLEKLEAADCVVKFDQPLEGFERAFTEDPFGNRIELLEPV